MAENPLACSACGKEIALGHRGDVPALCPHCGAMIVIDDVDEQQVEADTAQANEQELEERRIRQIVRERRALVRTRGWHIVVMLACTVLAAQQLAGLVTAVIRGQRGAPQVAQISLALILLVVAWMLRQRVKGLTAELKHSALTEPTTPPDFGPLSDGSQHARNLEDLGRDGQK